MEYLLATAGTVVHTCFTKVKAVRYFYCLRGQLFL
jgi:hypothetical protein